MSATSSDPVSSLAMTRRSRRTTPVTLAPSSRPMNCFLLVWRGMAPEPGTSTVLIRFPPISRSRSRRRVSISGTSAISSFLSYGVVPEFSVQALPRVAGCRLFGLLLGSSHPAARRLPVEHHHGTERLVVLGAVLGDLVRDLALRLARHQLVQPALVIR